MPALVCSQMFVHSAFPVSMPKYVYWGFVGALFRESAPKVLRQVLIVL
jgi:hypothetical protein